MLLWYETFYKIDTTSLKSNFCGLAINSSWPSFTKREHLSRGRHSLGTRIYVPNDGLSLTTY